MAMNYSGARLVGVCFCLTLVCGAFFLHLMPRAIFENHDKTGRREKSEGIFNIFYAFFSKA
jgi:hypothetical protein